ncbi:hypothetical protein BH23CHL8_BH23CHL8_16590 [soil metagenome]
MDEECPQRAAFLTGSWTDIGCELELFPCIGVLEPGRHDSALLDPRGDPRDPPLARPGGLSYEVPTGWSSVVDWLSQSAAHAPRCP